MFPLIYCLNGNITNCSLASRIHFSLMNELTNVIQTNGQEPPQNLPFPLGWGCGPHLIHQCLGQPHSSPQMEIRLPHAMKSTLVTMGRPTFTPKIALTVGKSPSRLLASSLDPADLPTQMASRSNQPFFHNTPDRHTQTDRWDRHLYQYPLMLY